jgi:hypothetical protein
MDMVTVWMIPLTLGLVAGAGHPPRTVRDTLVMDHAFTAATEFARVRLRAGQVYRVEVSDARRVQVRPLRSGVQGPTYLATEDQARSSGTRSFDLAPAVTAEYEVRVAGIREGTAPVRIDWDRHATARRQRLMGHAR